MVTFVFSPWMILIASSGIGSSEPIWLIISSSVTPYKSKRTCVTGVLVGAGVTVTGAAVGSILSQIGSHGSYKQVLKEKKTTKTRVSVRSKEKNVALQNLKEQ